MKLLFSEQISNYKTYEFPYVVWAVPEAGEAPADLFNAGFLPSSRGLDCFGLCRNVRVDLPKFQPSSENRRVLRKGEGITMQVVPRAGFELTPARREFYVNYAAARFGEGVMPPERLELVFNSPVATHVLVFTDPQSGAEVGVAVLYLEAPRVAFYRFAFFDLNHFNRSLGLFMMTSAVAHFAREKFSHLYLGTCYSERALYKTQFAGVEFFNGFRWSNDLAELKFLIQRDLKQQPPHLLESQEYREQFCAGDLANITGASAFSVKLRTLS
jgi:arginyl-tRNA--protein-N-Asp/Glu arginylyltransferase